MNLNSFVWCGVLFAVFLAAAGQAYAQTFDYNSKDVLVCFRKTTNAVNDLVVDAGSISTFTNLSVGQTITISEITATQLAASVGTNNVAWSVLADDQTQLPHFRNLWVTKPRSSYNTQTSPWAAESLSTLGNDGGGNIEGIGMDAIQIGGNLPGGANNSTNVLVEPESGNNQGGNGCYAYYVGANGNLINFQGVVEQTTPPNFTTSGLNVRADFYQLLSTNSNPSFNQSPPVKYLGYFEFSTNGVMTYTAGPSPSAVTAAVITSFTRVGTTNTVTFTTGSGGTYSLCGTNSAGLTAARTSWPAVSSVAGSGSPQSLVDVTADAQKFYLISAQ